MQGTEARGAAGPWPVPGSPKRNLGRLNFGTWGTGRHWEGVLQTWDQDLGKGRLRVRTPGTGKGKTHELLREAGGGEPGQGLRKVGSRQTAESSRNPGHGTGVAEALASWRPGGRRPEWGPWRRPTPPAQAVAGSGAANWRAQSAHFSPQLLHSWNRRRVGEPGSHWVRWPLWEPQGRGWEPKESGGGCGAGLGCQAWLGTDVWPPQNRMECPWRLELKADRMSGAGKWVSPEQQLCPAARGGQNVPG